MTYPSNTDSVAQDQIKAFVDRILRMKGEVKALNMDIREIYAEAKGNGFDKTVLGKLVNYVEKREADATAVMESESIFDLYLTAYDSAKKSPHAHAREESTQSTTPKSSKSGADSAKTALAATTPITEPQPAPEAGSDLTAPPANDDGQVADIQPETANEKPETSDFASSDPQRSVAPTREAGGSEVSGDGDAAPAAAAPGSKYPAPGVVIWESTPPEGVDRHDYSYAFGSLGQDIEVIKGDMDAARAEPIVKIGRSILDGWARYAYARSQIDADGKTMEYSVVQYAGDDPLMDCIRMNLAGRILTSDQSFRIAQALAKKEPKRKREIYAAFELGMVLA